MLLSGYSSPDAYALGKVDINKSIETAATAFEKLLPSLIQLRTYNAQLKLAKDKARRDNDFLDTQRLQSDAPKLGVEVSANPQLTQYMLIGGAVLLAIILMQKRSR